jgi:hypothetical protein
MASNTNRKSVVITLDKDGDVDIQFNTSKALGKFRGLKGVDRPWREGDAGARFTIGLAYFLADTAGRDMLVAKYGKGALRRGLMVASRGTKDEAVAAKVTALAESLRKVSTNA